VATIRGTATVADAVAELGRHRVGALVVSADGRHIDGIVSERDVVRGLGERNAGLLDEKVASIMSATVRTCSPQDDTESLMALMTEQRIRHVPVVRDGVLCGIVSIGDVVKCRIGELERDRNELVDYINAR
jgi:CBS domain-containing protein